MKYEQKGPLSGHLRRTDMPKITQRKGTSVLAKENGTAERARTSSCHQKIQEKQKKVSSWKEITAEQALTIFCHPKIQENHKEVSPCKRKWNS